MAGTRRRLSHKESVKQHEANALKVKIMEEASRLFRKNGFNETTVEAIAEWAGIAKGSVYNYFDNKHGLLYEILARENKQLNASAKAVQEAPLSPQEKLAMLVRLHLGITCNGQRCVAAIELRSLKPRDRRKLVTLRNEYEKIYRKLVEDAIAEGYVRECDPVLVARLILGIINSIPLWFNSAGPLSYDLVAEEICNLVLRGLLTPRPDGNKISGQAVCRSQL